MYSIRIILNTIRQKESNLFNFQLPTVIVTIFLSTFFLVSCHQRTPDEPLAVTEAATRHASLLEMQDLPDQLVLCRIHNPWQPRQLAIQYLLTPVADTLLLTEDRLDNLERQYGPLQVLVTPLQQQTVTAACHAHLLEVLEADSTIGVLCDADYICSRNLQQALYDGRILDGGLATAPNAEVIKAANSQAIWISPYEGSSQAVMQAVLPDLPVIYCADYMESTPLGRAEWMRFYGRLIGKTSEADSLFQMVENCYNTLSAEADTLPHPTLLAESPYGATWYVPGGRSTMSWLYQDAGFRYPWSEDVHGGSLALSPEAVFAKAQNADVWVIKYFSPDNDWSLQDFIGQNPLFRQFEAAQQGKVFGCNTAINDYFESTPFRPDLLLLEMKHIRNQEYDSLRYFHQLK